MKEIHYDLLPPVGVGEVCKVLSRKLEIYGKNKWKEGLPWTEVLSSLRKHLLAFESGQDYTEENMLHMAEVAADALILSEYYSIYPQGDDRVVVPINKPIVALDLDDTVFDFLGTYEKTFGKKPSDYWEGDYSMMENLNTLKDNKDWWINLPVKHFPSFEVDYYVTARSIPIEWTQEAIQKNNLPKAKIYTLPWNACKIDTLKQLGIQIFIDDKYQTFKECLNSGIFCYLMDAPHNKHYNVGHHRIFDLNLKIK